MSAFTWALAGFVLIHVGISATGLRARLVGRIGEGPYRALFALASLALLAWLIVETQNVREDPFHPLHGPRWEAPDWLGWIMIQSEGEGGDFALPGPSVVLAFLGIAFAVAGVLTPGPTLAGYEKRGLAAETPARGMLRITRHPFLWGVALWGAGHLMVNPEAWAIMLFGTLTFMTLLGTRSIDRKGRARDEVAWARFEDVTSNVPFAAIVQGRNSLKLGEIGWRGLVGIAAALALMLGHEALFDVAAISTPP